MNQNVKAGLLVGVLAVGFAACGPVSENTDGNGTQTDGGTQSGNDNEWQPCSSTNKCPSGQFCFNGLCAYGCQSNGDCAADQYCDTEDIGPPYFCKNKTVPTCPDTPCPEGQVCRQGLCSAAEVPTTQCNPNVLGQDGCDAYSVCLDEDEDGPKQPACVSFPPCAEGGACPTGTVGAVCNEGYIPEKGRFCMTGLCSTGGNCPDAWFCVKQTSNQPLGFCSSGGPNQICFQNADCLSNNCFLPDAPGYAGFCM